MNRNFKLLKIFGIVLIFLPFIGVPQLWKDIVLFIIGFLAIATAFVYQAQSKNLDDRGSDAVDDIQEIQKEVDEIKEYNEEETRE